LRSSASVFDSESVFDSVLFSETRDSRLPCALLLDELRFVCWPTLFFELSLPNTLDELFDSRSLVGRCGGAWAGFSAVLYALELDVPPLDPQRLRLACSHFAFACGSACVHFC
jgi:hypothetical protein